MHTTRINLFKINSNKFHNIHVIKSAKVTSLMKRNRNVIYFIGRGKKFFFRITGKVRIAYEYDRIFKSEL